MASSKIKGIVIEIGGNTTKLQDALKGVDKQVYSLNGDLKALNQALKLDPKNTELLAQKQEVLARNIQASKDRLETLKEAQRQMGDYNKLTDEQKTSYNQLSLEIAKSESALKSMNEELKKTNSIDFSKMQEGLKKVGEVALDVSKKMLQISGAIAGAITGVVAAGVKSYANLEKAQEGSKRLFGDSFKTVEKNAAQAYKTMGLSASEYYDQVNTYAVGLKNTLGGDTKRAAQLSNDILKAQADIVAATGASQEQVQSAFSAVMRGNYSLLDNLRVGIKGSKTGMQEVIQKVNEWNKAQGHATHYQMDNYADMQQALIDYTKMVGVAGTAEQQMSKTISGSLSQMKAAWSNFLSGVGSAKDVSSTLTTFLKNVLTVVKKLAPELIKGLVDLFNDLIPEVLSMATELLPIIIEGVKSILEGIINFINNDSKQFVDMAVSILSNLVQFIIKNLPLILEATIKIIAQLAQGLAKELPNLIPVMVDAILVMVEALIDNIDLLLDGAIAIVIGLAEGIINSLPKLIEKVPTIIMKLVEAIIKNAPKMLEGAVELIAKLVEGLINGLVNIFNVGIDIVKQLWEGIKSVMEWLWEKLTDFGQWIIDGIKEGLGLKTGDSKMIQAIGEKTGTQYVEGVGFVKKDVQQAGTDLVNGITTGINNSVAQNKALAAIFNFANRIKNSFKKNLEENSPSKATFEMGQFLDLGLKEGIENNANDVIKTAASFSSDVVKGMSGAIDSTNSAMQSLTNGVEASVNPTINPTANSNPIYITIDKFYNNRETDVQQLAEELEFYRKNSALAKGGV